MVRVTARRSFAAGLAVGLAVAGLAAAGVAVAATTGSPVIQACAAKKDGSLRIATSCRRSENALTWNVQGPQGEPGPSGPPGPAGAAAPTPIVKVVDLAAGAAPGSSTPLDLPAGTYLATVSCTGAGEDIVVSVPLAPLSSSPFAHSSVLGCNGPAIVVGPGTPTGGTLVLRNVGGPFQGETVTFVFTPVTAP